MSTELKSMTFTYATGLLNWWIVHFNLYTKEEATMFCGSRNCSSSKCV